MGGSRVLWGQENGGSRQPRLGRHEWVGSVSLRGSDGVEVTTWCVGPKPRKPQMGHQ